MAAWMNILSPFERRPAATGDLTALVARYRWPAQYVELLGFMDGGEGFIGNDYVRIFGHRDAVWLNDQTPLRDIRDGLFIFGSTGGGEAFAFDQQAQNRVVQVPFIPIIREYVTVVADDLHTWLASGPAAAPSNPELVGKEIYEVKPIVFGGDPVDPKNKALLDLRKYIEAAVWWNNLYRQMRPPVGGTSPPL